jgi:hypothetical protein
MDSLLNPAPHLRRRSGLASFLLLPTALLWSINVLRTSGWIASPWFVFEAIKGVVLLALAGSAATSCGSTGTRLRRRHLFGWSGRNGCLAS